VSVLSIEVIDEYSITKKVPREIFTKHGIIPQYGNGMIFTKANIVPYQRWCVWPFKKSQFHRWEEPLSIFFGELNDGQYRSCSIRVYGRHWLETAEEIAKEIKNVFPKIRIRITLIQEHPRTDFTAPSYYGF